MELVWLFKNNEVVLLSSNSTGVSTMVVFFPIIMVSFIVYATTNGEHNRNSVSGCERTRSRASHVRCGSASVMKNCNASDTLPEFPGFLDLFRILAKNLEVLDPSPAAPLGVEPTHMPNNSCRGKGQNF